MINDFFKSFSIGGTLPSSMREVQNGYRNWKNKARVCMSEIFRELRKIRKLFKGEYQSETARPNSFFRFCNEGKSKATIICRDCGGIIDVHNPYFIELFSSYDTATNEYIKTLLQHSTEKVWPTLPSDEMAECFCYAPFNTENKLVRAETSKMRSERDRLHLIIGGGNARNITK